MKPDKIIVDTLILRPIPKTWEYAQQIFDTFNEDKEGFVFWMRGKSYDSVTDVYMAYQKKYKDTEDWHFAMYGIFLDDDLLGEIGLSGIDVKNQTAEIGYWLKPSARGRGIINKLIPAIENLGFNTLGLRKIYIWCDVKNFASVRRAQTNNYVLDGILRERQVWSDGSIHSTAIFGKLKSEYCSSKQDY